MLQRFEDKVYENQKILEERHKHWQADQMIQTLDVFVMQNTDYRRNIWEI